MIADACQEKFGTHSQRPPKSFLRRHPANRVKSIFASLKAQLSGNLERNAQPETEVESLGIKLEAGKCRNASLAM
jgi:hypothetical protein